MLKNGADTHALDRLGRTPVKLLTNSWKDQYKANDKVDVFHLKSKIMSRTATMLNTFVSCSAHTDVLEDALGDPMVLFISIRLNQEDLSQKLLDYPQDFKARIYQAATMTLLEGACYFGCSQTLIKKLLAKSKCKCDTAGLGSGLIYTACERNYHKENYVVLALLQAGFDPNVPSAEGQTALMVAAKMGNVTVMETLLSHNATASLTDKRGWGVIHYALMHRKARSLPVLKGLGLDWGAKVRAKFGRVWFHGATALHIAASLGNHSLEYILDNGCISDINGVTDAGETALFVASYMGRLDNVSTLLSRNADETILAKYQAYSPLHIAAQQGHEDIVVALFDHGCNVHAKTSLDLTPELVARRSGHLNVAILLEKYAGEEGTLS